jgi:hypothetical protein
MSLCRASSNPLVKCPRGRNADDHFSKCFLLIVIQTNVIAPTGVKGKKTGKNEKLG